VETVSVDQREPPAVMIQTRSKIIILPMNDRIRRLTIVPRSIGMMM
jgi:hypothetical protein